MIVYKVCQIGHENKWLSATTDTTDVIVGYKLNKWTKPRIRNSALFTFSNWAIARTWAKARGGVYWEHEFIVLQCEAEPFVDKRQPHHRDTILCMTFSDDLERCKLYWSGKIEGLFSTWSIPEGTVLCSRVKPTGVVR